MRIYTGRRTLSLATGPVSATFYFAFALSLVLGALVIDSPPAAASNDKPPTHDSYYVTSASTSWMYNRGKQLGEDMQTAGITAVVLDFGGQNGSNTGTKTVQTYIHLSYGTVKALAENFAQGFWVGTGSNTNALLKLGIGTNNSYYSVNNAGGSAWASVVSQVKTWVSNHAGQVDVLGANDIESWGARSDAESWVNGFSGHGDLYFNYGSADGCPTSSSSDASCSAGVGWTRYWYWWMSWGASPALSTPEIYFSVQADQWGAINSYKHISFDAPLDERAVCSSTLGAQDAWNDLKAADGGQNPPYSMSIRYENGHTGC